MMPKAKQRTIWMVTSHFYPIIGGGQLQVQRQAKELRAQGWDVRVLTRRHSEELTRFNLPEYEVIDSVPVIRINSGSIRKLGSAQFFVYGLWYLLRHGRGDIYHAHGVGAAGWLAVLSGFLLGGRSLIKMRNSRSFYQEYYASKLAFWQFRFLLRSATKVIAISSDIAAYMRELGVSTVAIPNGIDLDAFQPASAQVKQEVRSKLGLPLDKAIVLTVGTFKKRKGMDLLVEAWAALSDQQRSGALLLLVGDGEERANLTNIVDSNHMASSVIMAGMQDDVYSYYQAADLFVLSSRAEGLSNALLEAGTSGLPLISSDISGSPDIIDEGDNGYLFKVDDRAGLTHILSSVLAAPERWQELGIRARAKITAYADIRVVAQRLGELYQSL